MNDSTNGNYGWVAKTLLVVLAAAGVMLIIAGALYYGLAVQAWMESGYIFTGWGMIDWIVGLIGAAGITVGLILIGIFLRLVKWPFAPFCSLWLSILTVAFTLSTYLIFSRFDPARKDVESWLLLAGGFFQLLAVALPPFLHWLLARQQPAAPAAVVAEIPKVR